MPAKRELEPKEISRIMKEIPKEKDRAERTKKVAGFSRRMDDAEQDHEVGQISRETDVKETDVESIKGNYPEGQLPYEDID